VEYLEYKTTENIQIINMTTGLLQSANLFSNYNKLTNTRPVI